MKPTMKANNEISDPQMDAARRRLRESVDQADALEGFREIITNFLGCEEIGIFKVDRERETLKLVWSFGIDPDRHKVVDSLNPPDLQRVIDGELHFADFAAANEGLNPMAPFCAFVPLRSQGETVAVLGIQRWLPQKTAIDDSDRKLLQLLSDEAGRALFGRRTISSNGQVGGAP
ncbi:MAG TPA: GAF domain-containing protein [Candidatus Saccharimonadales bacterium]|nr:GAF domain-containing protein [Candidatus Saccharimonadales bacterium]